jgi:ketosteroid isomerase-like protein
MGVSTLSPQDEQALKDITKLHLKCCIAADWKTWMSTCSEDVILLPPDSMGTHGLDEGQAMFETFPTTLEFEGEPSVIKGSGDMAFTSGYCKAKLVLDDTPTDVGMKWLALFERQADGGWKVIADMWNDAPL